MTFKVGDPDPTPAPGGTDEMCWAEDPKTGEYCTWHKGDPGDGGMHVAGDGSRIRAVWPMDSSGDR